MGCLRWYSLKEKLALDFEDLVFSKFVDKNTLQLDILKMIKTVINHSSKSSLKVKDIQDALEKLCSKHDDLWHVCCGHDIVHLLVIGFQKMLGSHSSSALKAEEIERSLRLSYEEAYFHTSELYQGLLNWQKNNSAFSIF